MTALADARAALDSARSILVLTGAGISKASGLPVYRGEAGSLYDDPGQLRDAMGGSLREDPAAYWRLHAERRARFAEAAPNEAHRALARLEHCAPRFLLATQNIDNLHRRAGSRRIVELHGNVHRARCSDDACPAPSLREETDPAEAARLPVPACARCQAPLRPDIVLFGEADQRRWEPLEAFIREGLDLLLLVGTSGVVPVPSIILDLIAAAGGAPPVIAINPAPASAALEARITIALRLGAVEALEALVPPQPPGTAPR